MHRDTPKLNRVTSTDPLFLPGSEPPLQGDLREGPGSTWRGPLSLSLSSQIFLGPEQVPSLLPHAGT